jgi:Transposase DDE domain group 1
MRLYFSAMAYVLVCGLRRLGLKDTELEKAQAATIRTRQLKIGAQVRVGVRRVYLATAASYPWGDLFAQVHAQLRATPLPAS